MRGLHAKSPINWYNASSDNTRNQMKAKGLYGSSCSCFNSVLPTAYPPLICRKYSGGVAQSSYYNCYINY